MSQQSDRRQAAVLAAIREYVSEHGYPPSYRELGEMTGISSTSMISVYLKKLAAVGAIEQSSRRCRALRVTE